MPRFQANNITDAQVTENLKVLATFRTQVLASSNLTIREGLFKKTSGKLNLFKGIVRDEQDSLTNQAVLDEILTNLTRFETICTNGIFGINNDDNFDILCNAMYGFLNLGSKYRDREVAGNIADAMSKVCIMAQTFFVKRLGRFRVEKAASYTQSDYNAANQVHLNGTCWALVLDWARKWVLNNKLGYAHKGLDNPFIIYDEKKLLHRGKYIANVFNLSQNKNYDSVGEALIGLNPKKKTTDAALLKEIECRDLLLQRYDSERSPKFGNRTVVDKFKELSFTMEDAERKKFPLKLCEIHIGNQNDKGKNTRIECINDLTNKINIWIQEAKVAKSLRIAHGINFYFDEKIGYQRWKINAKRQLNSKKGKGEDLDINMYSIPATKIVRQRSGHALGFAYSPSNNTCCFMDPNFGEWVSTDARKVASIIYDVFKIYTVSVEKDFNEGDSIRCICKSINETYVSLIAKKI